jgi:hypothetical protein
MITTWVRQLSDQDTSLPADQVQVVQNSFLWITVTCSKENLCYQCNSAAQPIFGLTSDIPIVWVLNPISSFTSLTVSVADPDPFDPDPAFQFETGHCFIRIRILTISKRYGNVPKTVLLYIFTWFSLSVRSTGPTKRHTFFPLPVSLWIRILENDT